MRLGAQPQGAKLAATLTTQQKTCQFYTGWFFRLHYSSEAGWVNFQTPDGLPIMAQDAFFWQSLEVISRTLSRMMSEERNKMAAKGRKRR